MKKTTRNFVYDDGKSNKYWNIEISGKTYTVNYGKVGAPKGQSTTKEFDSEEDCTKAAEKVIKEKTGKGYVEK